VRGLGDQARQQRLRSRPSSPRCLALLLLGKVNVRSRDRSSAKSSACMVRRRARLNGGVGRWDLPLPCPGQRQPKRGARGRHRWTADRQHLPIEENRPCARWCPRLWHTVLSPWLAVLVADPGRWSFDRRFHFFSLPVAERLPQSSAPALPGQAHVAARRVCRWCPGRAGRRADIGVATSRRCRAPPNRPQRCGPWPTIGGRHRHPQNPIAGSDPDAGAGHLRGKDH